MQWNTPGKAVKVEDRSTHRSAPIEAAACWRAAPSAATALSTTCTMWEGYQQR